MTVEDRTFQDLVIESLLEHIKILNLRVALLEAKLRGGMANGQRRAEPPDPDKQMEYSNTIKCGMCTGGEEFGSNSQPETPSEYTGEED